jgi:hypoxanthine phosphoribosyltransferase
MSVEPAGPADALAMLERARPIASADDVTAAIARMAREIEAALSATNPVILSVMHGGAFCAVELAAHWRFPYEFDYVHVTRYANRLTGGALEWRVRPNAALAGRTVLIVDDIVDRGTTLRALQNELERIGVARQLTAALVVKRLVEPLDRPRVDFRGLEIDDVYVFGCGMDCRGYWRGLRGLWAADA